MGADYRYSFYKHQRIKGARSLNSIVEEVEKVINKVKVINLTEQEKSFVEKVIIEILDSANAVFQDIGEGWPETVYQKAMEVELRERGIKYEEQIVLPVYYKDKYIVGEGKPDLIILVELESGKRVHIVIELKTDTSIKEDNRVQIQRYIKALNKSLKSENDIVFPVGFIINFTKRSNEKIDGKIMQVNNSTIQWLEVDVEI
jgi:GxxExxY protein